MIELSDIPKNVPTKVSEADFKRFVASVGSKAFQEAYARQVPIRDNEEGSYVLVCDGVWEQTIISPDLNMLIIGDVKAPFVSALDPSGAEMGHFIVIGNVECDYFENEWGKQVFIDGNLTVNKILNDACTDSSFVIINNLYAEFYLAINAWVECGGEISLKYGIGYAFPLNYKSAKEAVDPEHSPEESAAFLGTTVEDIEDGDFIVETFQALHPETT